MIHLSTFLPYGALAALASCAAMLMLYAVWLSPLMFGRAFVRLSGIRPSDLRPADVQRIQLGSLVGRIVWALLLGAVAGHTVAQPGMMFACVFMIWLFLTFEQLLGILTRREPFALYLLITLRSLATLMLGAFVYYLWSIL